VPKEKENPIKTETGKLSRNERTKVAGRERGGNTVTQWIQNFKLTWQDT